MIRTERPSAVHRSYAAKALRCPTPLASLSAAMMMRRTSGGSSMALQPAGVNRRPAGPAKELHCAERALDAFPDDELRIRIVFREADRPAMDHAAAFALVLFRERGLAAAVTAQIGQVHANLLAGHVDDRGQHRWQAGAEPVRCLLLKSQYRRGQPDPAAAQIDGDPLVPNAAVVDLPGMRDSLGVIALTDSDTPRHMEIIAIVVIVEQTIFDERRHDLVECAAAKTEGQ